MKIEASLFKTFELLSNRNLLTIILLGLFFNRPLFSQLPTAAEVAANMTAGWNIGNQLLTKKVLVLRN